MSALRRQCPSNKTSGSAKRKNGTICQSGNKLALTEAELRLPVCRGLGMHDRPNSESARAQYRRLAQRCLLMVATIQDQEGRTVPKRLLQPALSYPAHLNVGLSTRTRLVLRCTRCSCQRGLSLPGCG